MNFQSEKFQGIISTFDAFISYNSREQDLVEEIARRLDDDGITVWKDNWELIGGEKWIDALPDAIAGSRVFIAFVGQNGLGPWHKEEIDIGLSRAVRQRTFRVIPVALPSAPEKLNLPAYLDTRHIVNMRNNDDLGYHHLKCSILGRKPGRPDKINSDNSLNDGRPKIVKVEATCGSYGYGFNITTHNNSENGTILVSGFMVRIHHTAEHPISNTVPVYLAPIGQTKAKKNLSIPRNTTGSRWTEFSPEHFLKPREIENYYAEIDISTGVRCIVSVGIYWHNALDKLWRLEEVGYFALGCRGSHTGLVTNHNDDTYTPGQRNTDDPILVNSPDWPSGWPDNITESDLEQYNAGETAFETFYK